jgi:hypothetical protein
MNYVALMLIASVPLLAQGKRVFMITDEVSDFCRDIKRARHARFGPSDGDESGISNLKSDGTAVLASCITLSKSDT